MKSIARNKKKKFNEIAPTNTKHQKPHTHTHTNIDNCVLHTKKAHSMPEQRENRCRYYPIVVP